MADWPKSIQVDKTIVPLLSRQTYADFYQTLREFIDNSYDADATRVDVKINLHEEIIEIIDDGNGMTPEDFENNFLRLAHTPKKIGGKTELGRSYIGQFGVGFLSASPFCDKLIIESSKLNDDRAFEAVIDCNLFFSDSERKTVAVHEIPVYGRDFSSPSNRVKHYTKITLKGLTQETHAFFDYKRKELSRTSIQGWSGSDRLKWQLQQILPLEYPEAAGDYSHYLEHDWGTPLKVFFNGVQLSRYLLNGEIVDHSDGVLKIGNIECKYVIMTPWTSVTPLELVGLQIRLKNVGIGMPQLFGASTLTSHLYLTTRWICGEIQIIKGLENNLKLDRTEFNESEEYNTFYAYFREKIEKILADLEERRPKTRKISQIEKQILKTQNSLLQTTPIRKKKEELILPENQSTKSLIKRLEDNLGDNVYQIDKQEFSGDIKQSPMKIDTHKRTVTIVEKHPAFYEHVTIDENDFIIDYDSFERKNVRPDKLSIAKIDREHKRIILNKNFAPFEDKKYGDFYKKVFAVIEYSKYKYPKNIEIYEFIKNEIIKIYLGGTE